MLKRLVGALVVMGVCLGIALAEEFRNVTISKIDGDKVTFAKVKKGGDKVDEQTLTAAPNVKVVKGKYNEDTKKVDAGDAYDGGLKTLSEKLGDKGKQATIITDDNKKIIEIRVGGKKKKA